MGSTGYGIIIQTEGTEPLFYKAIKNYILSLSPTITCLEDPEEEFDVSTKGADHIATLNFSINGTHIFKMYRPDVLERDGAEVGVNSIKFELDAVEEIPHRILTINFRPSPVDYTPTQSEQSIRGLWIAHIVNNSFVYLYFGSYFTGLRESENVNGGYVYCLSNNSIYLAGAGPERIYDKTITLNVSRLTFYDTSTPGLVGSFLSRFTYAAPPGEVDYIKSSIYMSNNEKVFENRAIYDSTTVTIGNTVSLKDGSYVAVGEHQLVKVS